VEQPDRSKRTRRSGEPQPPLNGFPGAKRQPSCQEHGDSHVEDEGVCRGYRQPPEAAAISIPMDRFYK
jgi:hypothetical protein